MFHENIMHTIIRYTDAASCDFVLHAQDGEVSVDGIYRDDSVITEILSNLNASWRRVLAPEIFEIRVPRGLHPFVLPVPQTEKIPGNKDVLEKGDRIPGHKDVPEKGDRIPEHNDVPEGGEKIHQQKVVPEGVRRFQGRILF